MLKMMKSSLILRGRSSRNRRCVHQDMEKSAHLMPKDTETFVVDGGNHRGFACYNRQPLDWEVSSRETKDESAL